MKIINKRTKKWLIIIASIVIIIAVFIIDLTIYNATYKPSYEVGEQVLAQQIPIMTELFYQNKDVLNDLVSQTIDGPDYDVGFYNSVIVPHHPGFDYIPDGIDGLAQQLSDAGINLINIRKSERDISIWVYHETVGGTAATIFPRPTGVSIPKIDYVYSESESEDTAMIKYTKLADNWYLKSSNYPGGM